MSRDVIIVFRLSCLSCKTWLYRYIVRSYFILLNIGKQSTKVTKGHSPICICWKLIDNNSHLWSYYGHMESVILRNQSRHLNEDDETKLFIFIVHDIINMIVMNVDIIIMRNIMTFDEELKITYIVRFYFVSPY